MPKSQWINGNTTSDVNHLPELGAKDSRVFSKQIKNIALVSSTPRNPAWDRDSIATAAGSRRSIEKSGVRVGRRSILAAPRANPRGAASISVFDVPESFQPAGTFDHRLLGRPDAQRFHQRSADRQYPV